MRLSCHRWCLYLVTPITIAEFLICLPVVLGVGTPSNRQNLTKLDLIKTCRKFYSCSHALVIPFFWHCHCFRIIYAAFNIVKSLKQYPDVVWFPSTAKQTCLIEKVHSKFINKLPVTYHSKFPFTLTERHRFHTAIQIFKSLRQLSPPFSFIKGASYGTIYFCVLLGPQHCHHLKKLF